MKKLNAILPTLLMPLGLILISCEKDDPVPEINQEVITEITLMFTEISEAGEPIAGSAFEVVASDAEGISLGGSLEIDPISALEPGKKYRLDLSLYNHIAGEEVTAEVAEAGEEHQFYFLGSALVGETSFLNYSYSDADTHSNPIGLQGLVTVEESATGNSGSFRIILRHGLNKDYSGADNPVFEDFQTAGGESDLDITFQVDL